MKQLRIRGVLILYNDKKYIIAKPNQYSLWLSKKQEPYDLAEVVMLLMKLEVFNG